MESPPWMAPPGSRPCPRCGHPVGESYWSQNGDALHLECMRWAEQREPPYFFRLPEIRRRWQALRAELALVERVGRALREARARWPEDALGHARRVIALLQRLDLEWPPRGPAEREQARRAWYDEVGPRDH